MKSGLENNIVNAGETKDSSYPRWLRWLIGFGIWTALAVFISVRNLLYYYRISGEVPWRDVFLSSFIDFYLWGAVSPVIFYLCKKYPIERDKIAGRLFLHLLLGFAFAFFILQLSIPSYWYLGAVKTAGLNSLGAVYQKSFLDPYLLHQNALIYWITLLAAHTVGYYRQLRTRENQAAQFTAQTARLSEQLAQAQLNALKMQIHPHFLFNTLNAISALLDTDVKAADRMIARLSEFLRMTLKNSEAPAATLEKELEFLRAYLEIEKIRFQERLTVEIGAEPQTLGAVVPNLILQPLVENAVRHGIAQQTNVGQLRISTRKSAERLLIEIEDNGPGFVSEKNKTVSGVGLSNTTARLEHFYGGDFTFEITGRENPPGTIVRLNLPYLFEPGGTEKQEENGFFA